MPHTHRWPGDGRAPGVYCGGRLRNGEHCRQMLASYVGGGLFVVTRDRLIALVGDLRSIRCPICQTDNSVEMVQAQPAVFVHATSAMEEVLLSGGNHVHGSWNVA